MATRRIIWAVIVFSCLWALALLATGGFSVAVGSLRVSSRNPSPAIALAIAGSVALLVLALRHGGLISIFTDLQRFDRHITALRARWLPSHRVAIAAAILVLVTTFLGLRRGALLVGGSDSYGYVSQADLWAHGELTMQQPDLPRVQWPFAREVFAPLGYVPDATGRSLTPMYSPGLPMAMAVFARLFGRTAVFWVIPLLGGLTVWATYLLGRQIRSPGIGLMASLLTATHPIFLFQIMTPMSDIAAAAWWTLSLALSVRVAGSRQIAAGLSAGAAILTRPNLLPLVLGPVVSIGSKRSGPNSRGLGLLWFAVGLIPACAAIGFINYRLHGSPLVSGYGRLSDLYSMTHVIGNLRDYGVKLIQTQPLIVAVAGAMWLMSRRAASTQTAAVMGSLALMATTILSYVFYAPFAEWWSIRFMLPAIPAAMTIASAVIVAIAGRLVASIQTVTVLGCLLSASAYGIGYARQAGAFELSPSNAHYQAMGEYVRDHLPERAIVISMMHSGSVRYYSNRLSLRYDLVPADALDAVLGDLWAQDRTPCALLDNWEVDAFRTKFAAHSRLGALDWSPVATHPNGTQLFCFSKSG